MSGKAVDDDGATLNLREQIARIDNLLVHLQKKQGELLREALVVDNIIADTRKKTREYHMQVWQVFAIVFGAGTALIAAGVALGKIVF